MRIQINIINFTYFFFCVNVETKIMSVNIQQPIVEIQITM